MEQIEPHLSIKITPKGVRSEAPFRTSGGKMNSSHGFERVEPDDGKVSGASLPRVTRRTVVTGAAWAVPVVAMSVATPLAAASVDACADAPVEVRADSLAWNDFAGGTAAVGTLNGRPVYGANQPLFADLVLTNEGTTVITGFQTTFSLAKGTYTPGSVEGFWIMPDGTSVAADVSEPPYTDSTAPHLDNFAFSFFSVPTPPGGSATFRLMWTTAPSTGGQAIDSGIYAIGQSRSISCNGVEYLRTISDETNPANNDAFVINPFYVRSP